MTAHTIQPLRTAREFDRCIAAVERLLTLMAGGALLHYFGGERFPIWRLSTTGELVPPTVAAMLIKDPHIAGCGDVLFHDTPHQSYAYRPLITE